MLKFPRLLIVVVCRLNSEIYHSISVALIWLIIALAHASISSPAAL